MVFKNILRRRAVKSSSRKVLKKLTPYQVLIKPLITEKTRIQLESDNKCYFQIDKSANKNDVRMSIKYVYNVEPEDVNIINVPYKWRANRKLVRRSIKKAIVTLKKWDKIDLFS